MENVTGDLAKGQEWKLFLPNSYSPIIYSLNVMLDLVISYSIILSSSDVQQTFNELFYASGYKLKKWQVKYLTSYDMPSSRGNK